MTTVTLFIGNIPTTSTLQELESFIASGVSLALRLRSGLRFKIVKTEILKNVHEESLEIAFHGLVTIKPASLADSIIERLNGTELKGKPVVVRRFYERGKPNDQGSQDGEQDSQLVKERRAQISVDFDKEKSRILAHDSDSVDD